MYLSRESEVGTFQRSPYTFIKAIYVQRAETLVILEETTSQLMGFVECLQGLSQLAGQEVTGRMRGPDIFIYRIRCSLVSAQVAGGDRAFSHERKERRPGTGDELVGKEWVAGPINRLA